VQRKAGRNYICGVSVGVGWGGLGKKLVSKGGKRKSNLTDELFIAQNPDGMEGERG